MYIIQSSPVNPFKQQPAFLRLAAISPLCLYLQESGGYMAAESPLEAKIQISSSGKNPIWVREGGPTLRGHHTCPSSRITTLSGGIDSPWRALQNTKVSAENDFSPQVGFSNWVRHIYFFPKLAPDNADLHRVSEAAVLARKPYKRTYGDGWTLWTQQQPWSISRQVLSLIMNPRRRVDNV